MSEQAKTPWTAGPWAVHPVEARIDAMPSMLPVCALLWPTTDRSEQETAANAALIAEAPAMAALLDTLARKLAQLAIVDGFSTDDCWAFVNTEVDMAHKLISRIRGEA